MVDAATRHSLCDVFRVFAHPLGGSSAPLATHIVDLQARRCLREFLSAAGSGLRGECGNLVAVLQGLLDQNAKIAWSPTFARLKRREQAAASAPFGRSAVELGLAAHLSGVSGAWSFQLLSATSLSFDRWTLRGVTAGHVAAYEGRLTVGVKWLGGEAELELARGDEGGWAAMRLAANCDESRSVPVGVGGCLQILQYAEDARSMLPDGSTVRFCTPAELDAFESSVAEAVRLVEKYAVPYLDWCVPAIQRIVPTLSEKPGSGSHPGCLGLVVMSNDVRCAAIAEMLIHEASHQQLFVCGQLGGLINGSDEREYFSPLAGKLRPLDRVLLAYHALVNMGRFFAMCIESGNDEPYFAGRLNIIRSQIAEVRPTFATTTGLNEYGLSVLEALEECAAAL